MNPGELLYRLEAEGVAVALNLKATAKVKPSDDLLTLIRDNRDAMLEHLAMEMMKNSKVEDTPHLRNSWGLALHGDLLVNLLIWIAKFYELRLEHPDGVTLNAKPEHVRGALATHPWGVVYDAERLLLMSWGDVPTSALLDKRDLMTDELLLREEVAA